MKKLILLILVTNTNLTQLTLFSRPNSSKRGIVKLKTPWCTLWWELKWNGICLEHNIHVTIFRIFFQCGKSKMHSVFKHKESSICKENSYYDTLWGFFYYKIYLGLFELYTANFFNVNLMLSFYDQFQYVVIAYF